MNARIKLVRESLKLTQDSFGKRLGIARNTIANYETGNRTPSNAVITSICKEYNVNEDWLRTGEGEMFIEMSRDEELAEFFGKIQCSGDESFPRQFMEVLKDLDVDEWEVLAKLAVKLANKIKKD